MDIYKDISLREGACEGAGEVEVLALLRRIVVVRAIGCLGGWPCQGSKEALSTLFQRHARHVFNVAQRILKDTSEAEDLLQDLFLFVFQKAQLFDPAKASAASWIIQMTYHRALDRRRYLDSRHHYNHQEFKEDQFHGTRGQALIDQVTARTLLNKLRENLSTEQRQTLELHFFEGFSFHEIAEKTGQTHGNIRNHYYRGLERLRSHIFMEKHP